jgi:hypothetical protein
MGKWLHRRGCLTGLLTTSPGLTSSTCPVYQAECSKPRHRGKLVVVGSVCNTAAFCLANWMNYGLYFSGGPLQWRFPLAFQLVFPLVVGAVLPFLPESPRWLLLQDRHEEALAVIARLAGKNIDIHDPEVTAEFLSIKTAIYQEREDRVPVMDVLTFRDKTQNFRRLLLSCGTQFMQQFSGVNALGMAIFARSLVHVLILFQRLLLAHTASTKCRLRPTNESTFDSLQWYFILVRCVVLSTCNRSRRTTKVSNAYHLDMYDSY